MNKKITLFLLGKKGYECLKCLKKDNYQNIISKIIIGRDKNIKDDYADKIIKYSKQNEIVHYERNEEFLLDEFSIAIGWRWIIDVSKTKLLTFHDSLLPKYRGFCPLVNCLINGEEEVGASVIWGSKDYDKGNIIFQDFEKIQYPLKINKAIDIVTRLYINLLQKVFHSLIQNNQLPEGAIQDEKMATYSLWRDGKDYFINWNQSAKKISRFIDAVGYPYGGAKSYLDNEVIIINSATPMEDINIENRDIGKIIFNKDGYPIVVCVEGILKINSMTDINSNNLLPLKKFRSRFK